MKTTEKNLIKLLILISLIALFNGCAAKRADGTYQNTYSYHPYNKKGLGKRIYQTRPADRFLEPIRQNQRAYSQTRAVPQNRGYSESQAIQQITRLALAQMGKDYVWGANGPYNFDCSGFTKFVYSKNGIELPRVSKEQAQIGQFVPRTNLRKGDLVFFSTSTNSEVGHAGIYLGRGEFIHASSAKDRVVISSINSNYYSKHFKWGRRVVR